MKGERDFAGFVLPFAIGIFSVTGSAPAASAHISIIFLAAVSALLAIAIYMQTSGSGGYSTQRIITASLGLCCGIFIGTSDAIMSLGSSDSHYDLEKIAGILSQAIDEMDFSDTDTNALIKALIVGDRSGISPSIAETFRASGASHILALSGFHLGIIYSTGICLLSWTGGRKGISEAGRLIVMTSCGLYTIATGAGPSIVRAFIFILMRETALLTHRSTGTSSILLSALLLQLMIEPSSIRSVSFQLSYAAMAGIAYIYPHLHSFWPAGEKEEANEWYVLKKIWSSASLSISCQLTTGPLAFMYFGSFPKHFLLTNLIAIPVTGLMIPAALLTLAMSSAGICPGLLTSITEQLADALMASLEIISRM